MEYLAADPIKTVPRLPRSHMHIIINDQPIEVEPPITVHQLLTQLGQSTSGSALAINQVIIPKSQWESHFLNEQDNILLFQAIAGG